MKILYWKNKDGNICRAGDNYQVIIDRFPKDQEYKIIDDSELPDESFRNAWTYDLDIDIDNAKEIQKDKLRAEREPLLKELDVKVMMNITDSNKILEIEKLKQPLRDITKKVDACKTVEEIKKVTI